MEVRGIKGSGIAALAASIAIFAVAAPTAGAASFSVTGTADGLSACTAGSCPTLRSAVAAANTTGGTNTITLPAGTYTLTPASGEIKITNGDKLTVNGAGAGQTIIDGNATSRIFRLTGQGTSLSISGVTLQHGAPQKNASGGAIEDNAYGNHQITIDKSTLTHNSVTGWGSGGAIDSLGNGAVTVTDSTISGNTAQWGPGGGVAAKNLTMSGSTVNGNSTTGGLGGGIFLYAPYYCYFCGNPVADGNQASVTPSPSIVNSTIVGNSTGSDGGTGGGIMVSLYRYYDAPVHSAPTQPDKNSQVGGLITIVHDTIVGNHAGWGGGNIVDWSYTSVALQASIVGVGTPNNCSMWWSAIDDGSNMFFDAANNPTPTDNCFDSEDFTFAPNDILAGSLPLVNGPGLETDSSGKFALGDNGGPTQTIALLPGSPAIDAEIALPLGLAGVHGHAADVAKTFCADVIGLPVTTDQRGAQRPDVNATNCDIGAFESGAAPLALTGSVAPNPGAVDKPLVYAFTVTNNGPSFATHSTFSATLPPGTTFNSATPSQGSCVATSATTVDCALGVIPDGTANVTISVTPHAAGTSYAVTGTASDRESGASAPLTLSANVPANAVANGTTTTAPSIAPKPSTQVHACVSRRDFPIHVQHLRRLHITSATVYVNGLAVRTVRGKHLTAPIDLRQLPKGTFTITIVAHQRSGHVLRGKRTYHTCTSKLAGHRHLYL
jgi:uncharacterized repeat protein (TIGR01451 family)